MLCNTKFSQQLNSPVCEQTSFRLIYRKNLYAHNTLIQSHATTTTSTAISLPEITDHAQFNPETHVSVDSVTERREHALGQN
jgi:hypothetical protein